MEDNAFIFAFVSVAQHTLKGMHVCRESVFACYRFCMQCWLPEHFQIAMDSVGQVTSKM